MYFDFDDRNRRYHLAPEMRDADRITRERKLGAKSPKPYQLSMFTNILAGDDDDREDLCLDDSV